MERGSWCGWWLVLPIGWVLPGGEAVADDETISVESLLEEMVDFEGLARRPEPFFTSGTASSYSRKSHEGGDAWFDNYDVGQYVRTETRDGRREHVLADLEGPGTVTRFWSANPDRNDTTRFYFDGEETPRLAVPLSALFHASTPPFGPVFSYISGTGGNLYYPLPYARSLRITVEEGAQGSPLRLYYEIGHRTYATGTTVETFVPGDAATWEEMQTRVARALTEPRSAPAPVTSRRINERLDIAPGEARRLPTIVGEQAVFEWSVRVRGTHESKIWRDPQRAHNAYRFLLLEIGFDGARSIETPLGDFFGSAPGVNPYENLLFTVDGEGWMTSRLLMPFAETMDLSIRNAGEVAYHVELTLLVGPRAFGPRDQHLRAQWGAATRDTWPPFDVNLLETTGAGKVVGSSYQIANDVLIWWGEGDQKIFVDGESFPSTFGTGTEDDYGFAYGYNRPFTRPYHAQTRVDGPASGGHISLNRWYVLDALPYHTALRFDQEIWHWMPCRPTWTHVVYWYAAPGTPGPRPVDRDTLAPVDLGIREDMLDPIEGELLACAATAGAAASERLANCSRAEHLVWRGAAPGERLTMRFEVPEAGRYAVELNLCMAPQYGRQRVSLNGVAAEAVFDCYSPTLRWLHPKLGSFELVKGENVLEVEALTPHPDAIPDHLFGLDYIFLVRQ